SGETGIHQKELLAGTNAVQQVLHGFVGKSAFRRIGKIDVRRAEVVHVVGVAQTVPGKEDHDEIVYLCGTEEVFGALDALSRGVAVKDAQLLDLTKVISSTLEPVGNVPGVLVGDPQLTACILIVRDTDDDHIEVGLAGRNIALDRERLSQGLRAYLIQGGNI